MKKALGLSAAVAMLAAGLLVVAWWAVEQRQRDAGAALYEGRQPLKAHLKGQDWQLPAEATRCINCHEGAQAIGPPLLAASLVQPQPRRGGPPSRYDARSLCRLLRDGVDPMHVMVLQSMPRYEVSDSECETLWNYLRTR